MLRNRAVNNSVVGLMALIAFIFFLLCTISTPIVQSIYLFRASTVTVRTEGQPDIESFAQFGVFGACGTSRSFPGRTSANLEGTICTPTELSYEINTARQYQDPSGSFSARTVTIVDHNLSSALILNPIACGIAGLAMILSPIAALLNGRIVHGVNTVIISIAALISWAAFGVNTAIIVKAKNGAQDSLMGVPVAVRGYKFTWGAVMPLSLVAAVILSVAVVFSALSFFLGRSPPSYDSSYSRKEVGRGSTSSY